LCRSGVLRSINEVVGLQAGVREKPANHIRIVGAVVSHFGNRTRAGIRVSRESRLAGEVRRCNPDVIVPLRVSVGAGKPGFCEGLAGRVLVDLADHGGEEGRLRASEVIASVGIEYGAVVVDLEEEVFDHVAREVGTLVGYESENDEVTVPSIHLIEAAARNDIGFRKIEQAFVGNIGDSYIAHVHDLFGEIANFYLAVLLHCANGGWRCHARREIQDWRGCNLRVSNRVATGHRASQRIPTVVNVG